VGRSCTLGPMRHSAARASGSLALLLLASCGASPSADDAALSDAMVLALAAGPSSGFPDPLAPGSSVRADASAPFARGTPGSAYR